MNFIIFFQIKKVDSLTHCMEVEAKKMAAEVSAMDKEVDAMCVDEEQGNRAKRIWPNVQ